MPLNALQRQDSWPFGVAQEDDSKLWFFFARFSGHSIELPSKTLAKANCFWMSLKGQGILPATFAGNQDIFASTNSANIFVAIHTFFS